MDDIGSLLGFIEQFLPWLTSFRGMFHGRILWHLLRARGDHVREICNQLFRVEQHLPSHEPGVCCGLVGVNLFS